MIIKDGGQIYDCNTTISFDMKSNLVDEFKNKYKIGRFILYISLINEGKVIPSSSIRNLNESNIIERRRGSEWIISDIDEWYDLTLNA